MSWVKLDFLLMVNKSYKKTKTPNEVKASLCQWISIVVQKV